MRKYLIHTGTNNANPFIIRDKIYQAFLQTQFIEEIVDFSRPVEIIEEGKNASLDKIEINISEAKKLNIERIWRINLEKELVGISSKNYFKTPEVALLFLQKRKENEYLLHVILVEMKSSLNDSEMKKKSDKTIELKKGTLDTIPEKFQAGMNRLYLYLAIKNDHRNNDTYLDFQGLIFYTKNNIKKESESQLYTILANNSKKGLLTVESILDSQDKINVRFFNQHNISLTQLI